MLILRGNKLREKWSVTITNLTLWRASGGGKRDQRTAFGGGRAILLGTVFSRVGLP